MAYRLRAEPLPLLLATPSWSTGLLEPDELVDRLDTYRRLGARVSDTDFAQALLRVRREDRAAATAAAGRAEALGTPEGTRLARWLTSESPTLPLSRRRTAGLRVVLELGELLDLQEDFPAEFRALGKPVTAYGGHWYCFHWDQDLQRHWLAILPERRELVAARLVRDVSAVALDDTRARPPCSRCWPSPRGWRGRPPTCVWRTGSGHATPRTGWPPWTRCWCSRRAGSWTWTGWARISGAGAERGREAVAARRVGADRGRDRGERHHLGVLRRTLTALLADLDADAKPAHTRGLGDLLAVAAECAERSGARGELPHLAQTAARSGSSRLVTQARRLRSALVAEVAA